MSNCIISVEYQYVSSYVNIGINLSEDIFAGFNATLRGKLVMYKEFLHVGKGRDVGLQQTYKFEAKLSQGNAEQAISREMHRLCNRYDFFRLLSFYYGGISHYITNTLIMYSLGIVLTNNVLLALYRLETINGRRLQLTSMFTMLLSGMGILQTAPLAITLFIEEGFLKACIGLFYIFFTGGPLYFIFQIQTRCFYFMQTVMAGNAKYKPTGRGFVTDHAKFDQNFRYFAMSHLYLGFEIMILLILYGLFSESVSPDIVMGAGWVYAHPNYMTDSSLYWMVRMQQLLVYIGETWCLW